jgi:deoxyribonuclease IV
MLLGAHVSSTGGIDTAVDRAEALRLRSIQIFSQSTRMWRQTNHTPEAIARFRERRDETGLGAVVIHATYLINLAATDDAVYAKSLNALSATVGVGTAIGADGVVFHVGSHLGRGLEAALHQIVPGLQVVLGERDPDGPWLLLENGAGHQGTIGVTVEELALIIDELGRPEQVGICLDTCHLFASGIDITTTDGVDALLGEVDSRIGLDRLRCLHVNDSKMPFGSNRDRHANIGQGEIGKKLSVMLGHPKLQELPAIAETPGPDNRGPDKAEMARFARIHRAGVKQWQTVTSSR